MSAPRLKKLRVRGTNEQRYARLGKACRRKRDGRRQSALPDYGICFYALWQKRWAQRPPLSKFVNVTITRDDVGDASLLDALLTVEKVPYTDDGIALIQRALSSTLALPPEVLDSMSPAGLGATCA